jgi:hypothetical protein
MYRSIGGASNPDVKWYLTGRSKNVSRSNFFEQTVWAIWVSGKSRDAAESFLDRAESTGFVWDFKGFASWRGLRLSRFMERLHGTPVPPKAAKMWKTIHDVARSLAHYQDERVFQRSCFAGKSKSIQLNSTDVQRIIDMNINFVREVNAHFIVRNMGGEAIKCDRWVNEFVRYFGVTLSRLEQQLRQIKVRPGLFDLVLWAYCEKFVHQVKNFANHFNGLVSV